MTNVSTTESGAMRLQFIAIGCAAVGAATLWIAQKPPVAVQLIAGALAYLALILAGVGVARVPKNAKVLGAAAAACLIASFAVNPEWYAVIVLPRVAAGVAAACAVVVLLPRPYQLAVVSLAVLYHFAGILCAITSPPPSPWVSNVLWSTVFRPYLMFTYINNAYQFYSPEPGPACQLWFCVEDTDSKVRWIKFPKKPETRLDPLGVEYYRRLSLTEAVNQTVPMMDVPQHIMQRRLIRSDVPLHPTLPRTMQYRQPHEETRQITASYARRVAHEFGKEKFRNVKVYRVTHSMLTQQNFANPKEAFPYDPTTYVPFYLGEYDAEGRLKDPNDPLLYWVIPIVRSASAVGAPLRPGQPAGGELQNSLKDHAGADPFQE